LLAGALRQIGLITLRLGDDPGALITDTGLDRGVLAPEVEGIDVETGELRKLIKPHKRQRIVTFLSPGCLACRALVPHLNEVIETRSNGFEFVTICRGDVESCRTLRTKDHLKASILVDTSGDVEAAYDVHLTPFVYVVDSEGRVLVRGVANDWRHLESLLEQEGTPQTAPWRVLEEITT
jgi:methylamine dehydrogenase accessory protein MauD